MWSVRFDPRAFKQLSRLRKHDQLQIREFLDERLLKLDNPRQLGGPLRGSLSEFWRYRVGDLRILCRIEDEKLIVLAIGNRREVYR
jgi:mRNA interferase RelE/StbE